MSAVSTTLFRFKSPLTIAIHSIMLGTLFSSFSTISLAAETTPVLSKTQSVQIRAGNLDQALALFAGQTNSELSYDPILVAGKKTQGLNGQYTFEQGITQLLKGTGLTLVKRQDGTWGIINSKTQPREVGQLQSIHSTATQQGQRSNSAQLPLITVTADNPTYTSRKSTSATKLNLSQKETPQSISVITSQQIQDQHLTSLEDVMDQTPGISAFKQGQRAAGYRTFSARGFSISNYLRDGIPTSYGATYGKDIAALENSAIYEKIEVIRGSTGLTTGSGNPAASINLVRKRPTDDLKGSVQVSAGLWNNYSSTVDVSGPLDQSGDLKGRMVMSAQEGDNWQDRYDFSDKLIYGALDYDVSDKTVLTSALTYEKTRANDATAQGFPFYTRTQTGVINSVQTIFDRKDNPATDFAYSDTERLNILAGVEHQFNDNWKGVANYSYSDSEMDRVVGVAGSTFFDPDKDRMSIVYGRIYTAPKVHSLDLYTTGKFTAFDHEHTLSFGVNGYTLTDKNLFKLARNGIASISNWNGQPISYGDIPSKDLATDVDSKQLGIFGAANLQLLDPLKLVLGSRLSYWERDNGPENKQKENGVFTPYAGLIYDINHYLSAYASYTSIFNPSSRKDIDNNYLDPEQGNTSEFGLKSEFYDGLLNTSLAYFISKMDTSVVGGTQADGSTYYVQANDTKTKGWELTIAGEILPNWNIQAGYTYTDAKDNNGIRLNAAEIPKQLFKLFTSYKINQLTVGAGVNWQSEIYSQVANLKPLQLQEDRQKSYALVNAMAKYQINKDMDVRINLTNLFDKEYKQSVYNVYGDPRNFTATFTYKF